MVEESSGKGRYCKPGDEDPDYRKVLGSVDGMRRGYTTGTCAQAAVRAALILLMTGSPPDRVTVKLPKSSKEYSGTDIVIPVEFCRKEESEAEIGFHTWFHAGVVKDSGDDEDITHGSVIAARVRKQEIPAVSVTGGEGVGTVTSPGLPVAVGESAINPVPKRMILGELNEALKFLQAEGYTGGLEAEIYVPEGKHLAEKTWNPRIGITGGISIIGTAGVVEPKSSTAYRASIGVVLNSIRRRGFDSIIITPGYVGERYLFHDMNIPEERVATVGDHIGWSFEHAAKLGFTRAILAGHIGKTAKIAAGIFDTHWKSGDARLETVAAWAGYEGADTGTLREILECRLAEESVPILERKT